MLSEDLLAQVRTVAMEHPTTVEAVIKVLEQVNTVSYDNTLKIRILSQISNKNSYKLIAEMLKLWSSELGQVSSKELATALATAKSCHMAARKQLAIELVWTGPNIGTTPMRRTDQALLQLIREASEELTIISFAVYKIPELIEALNEATFRSVKIRIIAENPESSEGKISFGLSALSNKLAKEVELFIWPLDKRPTNPEGKHGSLHIKAAIADRKKLFISSANLTEYALTLNMEMGLLVYNQELASQIADHIADLIRTKILVRKDPNQIIK
jgi:phosphatidylserine/phosphatidylglycerophosphate/cardiolipin synthase-like enzyme